MAAAESGLACCVCLNEGVALLSCTNTKCHEGVCVDCHTRMQPSLESTPRPETAYLFVPCPLRCTGDVRIPVMADAVTKTALAGAAAKQIQTLVELWQASTRAASITAFGLLTELRDAQSAYDFAIDAIQTRVAICPAELAIMKARLSPATYERITRE